MQKELEKRAQDVNEKCPIIIDQTIRLDSCEVLPDNTFQYNYTFLFIDATKIDREEFKEEMKDVLLFNLQNNEELKRLTEKDVNFVYCCKDENGKPLGRLTITPEDYKNPINDPKLRERHLGNGNVEKVLKEMVKKTKQQLPLFTEGSGISLIDCKTYQKTLEYTTKLLNEDVARFDSIYFKSTNTPIVVDTLKHNPEMKYLADHGVTISYEYLDKNNKYLCTITILPEEYA
ncbi:hypothetical protein [Dysgonomonas macrotermitis]|uniref:Uncharacterized protein n=1 Tax=Dysgonomonas macrotermitis TaxID=1346286 RepID=A0A1M5F2Y6_9BACT|nr:hypothetical protein [Dysgonomonas macrotermitis]SHF85857.1 hypothetical protein SAMN05444362_11135 [Dysgonomonas macrotermitis]